MATPPEITQETALEEASHFGWVLYADKRALREGRESEVVKRVLERARASKVSLLGLLSLHAWILFVTLPSALSGRPSGTHGKFALLSPIAGLVYLALCLGIGAYLIRAHRRAVARIERGLRADARSG